MSSTLSSSATDDSGSRDSAAPKERRYRKFAPKGKTGCLTCRKRHVKCDESKPTCRKCVVGGWQCDGYSYGTRARRPSPNRPILPLSSETVGAVVSQQLQYVQTQSVLARFESAEEYKYFRHFRENVSYYLGGRYDPTLWNELILQASENEPAIKHAIIAIGALNLTGSSLDTPRVGHRFGGNWNADSTANHHIFALRQYSLAIKSMQQMASTSKLDWRATLLSSLLIICFETHHGNYNSATRQIRVAIESLEEATENGLLKPRANGDEELVRLFDRLDVQAMSHKDPYTLEEHIRRQEISGHIIAKMPGRFANISEARNYFGIILRRISHFRVIIASLGQMAGAVSGKHLSIMNHDLTGSTTSPSAMALLQSNTYLQEMQRFDTAFTPLFEEVQKSGVKSDIYLTSVIRTTFMMMLLMIRPHANECSYDEYFYNFKEIVEQCRLALLNMDDLDFNFTAVTIIALDIVGKKCRDPVLRREAIYLLSFRPRREGMLDSLLSAKVCTWVMRLEEEGMVDGFVPEEARLRNVGSALDIEGHKAHAWAQQWTKSGPRQLVKRETVFTW